MAKERSRIPTLLVDAGDFTNADSADAAAWNDFLLPRLARLSYDAFAPGEVEIGRGAAYLRRLADSSRIPLVSAALVDPASGRFLLPRFLLFERGGVTIAVTSVLSDSLALALPPDSGVLALDPENALQGVFSEIGDRAEVVVLLAHTSVEEAVSLCRAFPRTGICVAGHTAQLARFPRELPGSWLLLEVGEQGAYIGGAEVAIAPAGELRWHTTRATRLTREVAADSALVEEVQAFLRARGSGR